MLHMESISIITEHTDVIYDVIYFRPHIMVSRPNQSHQNGEKQVYRTTHEKVRDSKREQADKRRDGEKGRAGTSGQASGGDKA